MTTEEFDRFLLEQRIKAYVFVGVEAEMEISDAMHDVEQEDHEDDKKYARKRIENGQSRIQISNSRIDKLRDKL